MNINLSAANMNELALRVAGTVNELGFAKADKPMVASQALRVLANLAGHRVEHSLVAALKAETPEAMVAESADDEGLQAKSLLRGLVNYLERNYDEDQFDDTTKEFMAEANEFLYGVPDQVIYSPNEASANEGGGFWSNADGWGALETATRFTLAELQHCDLPRSTGNDARVVSLSEAQQAYGSEPSTMEETIEALQQRWGGDRGMHGEHPHYCRSDWQYQVSNGDTHLGYWEWVAHEIEMHDGEENHCSECGKELDGDGWDGCCSSCADVKAQDADELIDTLGLDRDDIVFWVRQHFLKDFEDEDNDYQESYVHQYRQCNGLKPEGSMVGISAQEMAARVGHTRHSFSSALLTHTVKGVEVEVCVCSFGPDAFFEVTTREGKPLSDRFYLVPESIDTMLEKLID